jgi:lysyl-tRNA synthetase, class II
MTTPEYHAFNDFQLRQQKLEELKQLNITPYPHLYEPRDTAQLLTDAFNDKSVGNSEDAAEGKTPIAKISGRLVLFRAMGKNAFAQCQDSSGRLQIMFNRELTEIEGFERKEGSPTPIKIIEKKLDLGDIIGVEGHLFRTQKGELTLYAKQVTLLCKTLLPLPDKHSGLIDKEQRYRKRWLDLISNEDVKKTFYIRSRIFSLIRNYFEKHAFMEVETPVLQNIYGGAEARPFTTTFHALNEQDMFMRISLEIALKKLIIGGFDKVYEIGKVFRNEGIDRTHNPEFTLLEAYAAYWDYSTLMTFVENLYEHLAIEIVGTTQLPYLLDGEEVTIDVKAPWKRMTMKEAIKEYSDIDVDQLSDDEIKQHLPDDDHKLPRGLLIAKLFEEKVESHLIQPHHITDHPIETTPLCKLHRDPEEREKGIVERFESFLLKKEICNAYTELNDPNLQRDLLVKQALKKEAGDEEAPPLDEEFIEAICQGMPPTGGIGIGLDRLVMLFTNASSIRDVIFFPFMKG